MSRWLIGKESAFDAGDEVLIPGLGRSPGEGNGNPLLYSCLGNPMDRGAWRRLQSMGSLKSRTGLNVFDLFPTRFILNLGLMQFFRGTLEDTVEL